MKDTKFIQRMEKLQAKKDVSSVTKKIDAIEEELIKLNKAASDTKMKTLVARGVHRRREDLVKKLDLLLNKLDKLQSSK